MTRLMDQKFQGFTVGVRVADSVVMQPALLAVKDKYHAPVALHTLKGIASLMSMQNEIHMMGINGVYYGR